MALDEKNLNLLIQLLLQKQQMSDEVFELTKKQQQFIEEADIKSLNKSITSRQKLLDKMQENQKQINRLMILYKKGHSNSKVDSLIKSTDDKIQKIISKDNKNQEKAQQSNQDLKKQIKELNHSRKTIVTYAKTGLVETSEYFDEKQ